MSEQVVVEQKLKDRYRDGKLRNLNIEVVETNLDVGNVYYVEFQVMEADGKEWDDDFYYIVVRGDNVTFYDDGIRVVQGLNVLLQSRKTFWQRITDFSLIDIVTALIAFAITLVFMWQVYKQGTKQIDDIDKNLVSIFSVIVGYYFGRVSSAAVKS